MSESESGALDLEAAVELLETGTPETDEIEAAVDELEGADVPEPDEDDHAEVDEEGEEPEPDVDDEEGLEDEFEEEYEDEQPLDPESLVTVKVDGEETRVTLKEALADYSGRTSLQRRHEALKASEQAFAGEKESVTAERAQYAQLLPVLIERLEAPEPAPDKAAFGGDTLAYLEARQAWQERQGERQKSAAAARKELDETQAKLAKEQQEKFQQHVAGETKKLLEHLPTWKDPKVVQAEQAKILEWVDQFGVTAEQLNTVTNHVVWVALSKAAAYDALKANGKALKSRKRRKVARPGGANPVSGRKARKSQKVEALDAKLTESGDLDAALDLMMARQS